MTAWWEAAFLALCLLALILTVLVLGFLRRVEHLLDLRARSVDDLAPPIRMGLSSGMRVGPFRCVDANGNDFGRADLVATSPSVVVFLEPGCPACGRISTELVSSAPWAPATPLVAILPDEPGAHAMRVEDSGAKTVYQDGRASDAFDTAISPVAFVVGDDARVGDRVIPRSARDLVALAIEVDTTRAVDSTLP